jgi:hypothetical protein
LLYRNDRHGHCIEPLADTYGDGHTYAHVHTCADSNAYANGHSDGDRHTYANGHSDGNRHAYANGYSDAHCHTYANGHSDGNRHTHADGHSDGNGHTDAVHGKMWTDAEAASDSSAAPHATRGGSCHCRSYAEHHPRASYRSSS